MLCFSRLQFEAAKFKRALKKNKETEILNGNYPVVKRKEYWNSILIESDHIVNSKRRYKERQKKYLKAH